MILTNVEKMHLGRRRTSPNTAYTLRAIALALRDIASYGRNVVYAGNVS